MWLWNEWRGQDDEVVNGVYSAKFWECNSRIGRRWDLDPVPDVSVSEYVEFENYSIKNSNPKGEGLIAVMIEKG